MEVSLVVHAIYPLKNNFYGRFQVLFKLCSCGIQGSMVSHEWLVLNECVWNMSPIGNLARCHADGRKWIYRHHLLFDIEHLDRKNNGTSRGLLSGLFEYSNNVIGQVNLKYNQALMVVVSRASVK
jgi:hypothetical protein